MRKTLSHQRLGDRALQGSIVRRLGGCAMDSWHATFLGLRHLPRELTAIEVEVFFQFSAEEARITEDRRRPELQRGLAL